MSRKTSDFAQIIDNVDAMSENQRRIIADGYEEEHYTILIEDYASPDDFQCAVVATLIKLLDLG